MVPENKADYRPQIDALRAIAVGSVQTCAMIAAIVLGASILGSAAAFLGIPAAVAEVVRGFGLSPFMLIVALIIFYLILGCFLDGFSMIVMTLPIVMPIVKTSGFDPIWFGIFLVLVVEMAQITPPVGFNLFVIQGLTEDGLGYVLRDLSGRYTTEQWAQKVAEMFYHYHADRVVAEVNNGGDLVETVLRSKDPGISYKAVHASRGKLTRAEPIAALYERHLIRHYGEFPELEEQMTSYAPDAIPTAQEKRKEKSISPDRMDALVWGMTELMLKRGGLFVA